MTKITHFDPRKDFYNLDRAIFYKCVLQNKNCIKDLALKWNEK